MTFLQFSFARQALKAALCTSAALALAGCAVGGQVLAGAAGGALEALGIKPSSVPDAQKPPRDIPLRLYAGANLNAANDRKPAALVVRVYKLKEATAFQQAAFDVFVDPAREKQVLGAELVNVREITLIPGQRYEVMEKVAREAGAIGVVALFRSPAPQRWKFAFDAQQGEKSGITIGLHACAMTLTAGEPLTPNDGVPRTALNLLSTTSCNA
ncbi:type VI secretion system lipoprotein TssJ [Cupriavidus sp. AU9028]|uniref:type VI secretion system lipoprotein TssJ n=1 Tax=Cupriavidus sp. AU9028 TaxID=2871157 RepID=UPI001C962A94|nr:type VI secretion system lipoprotein TssJ [Cupriavidus sp. AU9028]MBY4897520.1 type VI secretion system lipoprotein TssJ [Cupriavidus sp. AU9028]